MENFFPGSTKVERRFELVVREFEPRVTQNVEGIEITPYVVKHPCGAPPFALRLTIDGKVLCYSGDTEWVDSLRDAAEGADLFIAEANRNNGRYLEQSVLAEEPIRLKNVSSKPVSTSTPVTLQTPRTSFIVWIGVCFVCVAVMDAMITELGVYVTNASRQSG
jgi:hypothetical protein